jgi:tRNA threonylcarbamoyladenosine biosynthesis protein TsaE
MTRLNLTLCDPAATTRLGHFISAALKAGDVVALEGPLGAGKSVLARAIIQHACPQEKDIPSPTFTLVQTYEPDVGSPLMHFDLYRLDAPEDALELGIEDAFIESICLIEWAQRLGPYLPRTALTISIQPDPDMPDTRIFSLAGGARWYPLLADIETGMKDDMKGGS